MEKAAREAEEADVKRKKPARPPAIKIQGPSMEKKAVELEVLIDLAAVQKIMKAVLKSAGDYKLEYDSGWEVCGHEELKKIKF